jgi:hypothetical protein
MCLSSACRLIQKTLLLPLRLRLPGTLRKLNSVRNLPIEGSSSSAPCHNIKILLRSREKFAGKLLICSNR